MVMCPIFGGLYSVQPAIQILQIAFDIFEFLSNFQILQRKQIMFQDSKYFVHKACEHFWFFKIGGAIENSRVKCACVDN